MRPSLPATALASFAKAARAIGARYLLDVFTDYDPACQECSEDRATGPFRCRYVRPNTGESVWAPADYSIEDALENLEDALFTEAGSGLLFNNHH